MPTPQFSPIGITKAIDKATPVLFANSFPGDPVGPTPLPVIPENQIFTDGAGGLIVEHLFSPTVTVSLIGISTIHDTVG